MCELLEQRQKDIVYDQEAVLGVARDVSDVVGKQAQIQRVHDAALICPVLGRRNGPVLCVGLECCVGLNGKGVRDRA